VCLSENGYDIVGPCLRAGLETILVIVGCELAFKKKNGMNDNKGWHFAVHVAFEIE
jgi:hypothetical protein